MLLQSRSQRRWLGIIILLVAVGFVTIPGDSGPLAYFRSKARVEAIEQSIDSLNLLISYYQDKIVALESEDPFAIEQKARRFGFTYPGETVYEFELKGETADGE